MAGKYAVFSGAFAASNSGRFSEGPHEELVLWAVGRQEAAEVSIRKV